MGSGKVKYFLILSFYIPLIFFFTKKESFIDLLFICSYGANMVKLARQHEYNKQAKVMSLKYRESLKRQGKTFSSLKFINPF